ncbi:unnamed protein product [Miscanthus lutarioriparius]|uniref:Aminotransferase class I/classII large domain-containing protein n=1 Tax=Miscanthus lutarioriparius TaxID=422564 RepID=A0A811RWQ0_9POAL|nr:unnamed protein product [Miscanthus lutarioriparius]
MGGRVLASSLLQPSLSYIATSTAHGEDSPYFSGWRAYDKNPYDPVTNPPVSLDLLEAYLREHPAASHCGVGFRENALFQDYHGLKSFRMAMARFMETIGGGKARFDPDRIVLTAGATAANELLTFILANPGDSLLVPTPYYPGFDRDLRWRTGVNIVPVHCSSVTGFQVTASALQAAYDEAMAAGIRVRGVILTNPSNPLGTTVERAVLEDIVDFVARNDIHLVSYEIYSGSVFAAPDLVSVAEVVEDRACRGGDDGGGHRSVAARVHVVYSLSKDLGLPGFRVGVVYSYNDAVVATARRMSSFTLVSSQTQRTLSVGRGLRRGSTVAGELRLWRRVIAEAMLNISPGSSCHCSEPGWFRVCFANMSLETLDVALRRLSCFVEKWNKCI